MKADIITLTVLQACPGDQSDKRLPHQSRVSSCQTAAQTDCNLKLES